MSDTEQPALRMAEALEADELPAWPSRMRAAGELRRLHAENESLKAQLEAVGAGGVGPMIVSLCKERDYLSEGLEAARQEIARLREKNLEIDRLCDTTYVAQGADAYQHACDMMEQHQARRDAAGRDVGAEGSLCDGISWLYGRIAELEAHLEAVGGVGASAQPAAQAQDDVRDAARLEIARLQACLKKANEGFERFEREWYLRGDEIEALKAQLEAVGAGGVSPLIGASQAQPVGAAPADPAAMKAVVHDAVLAASIRFISRLKGMVPPPLECAPPEVTAPFKQFADEVMTAIGATAPQPAAQVQPYDQREMGLCDKCGWKGVIPYADGPVCVVCEHDKTLMTQPAAQAAPVDADTGRLNWLEQHSDGYYNIDRVSAIVGSGFFTGPFTINQKKHETLRAAIDAARAAQGGHA